MCQYSNVEWRKRFLCSVDDYFASCIWEAENRVANRVPDVATYIRMRPFAGALNTDIELIELCEHIYLPAAVYAHPAVQSLTLMCNNTVCWSNDIISLEKERQSGDMHNLVIAVRSERQCSWQAAVDYVTELHNIESRALCAACATAAELWRRYRRRADALCGHSVRVDARQPRLGL